MFSKLNLSPTAIIRWVASKVFLRAVYGLCALIFHADAIAASDGRPNVIFIITDDQQVGMLGVEGNKVANTPNIDRLGEEGVRFDNAFVVTPLCSPSRASFLTGNYARKHNVVNNDKMGLDVISHTLNTWPRQLREAGYETAFIGKWHMGLDDSRRPGFDRWFSFKGQGAYIDGVVNDEGAQVQTSGYMTDIINENAVEFVQRPHESPFAMIVSHKAVHWPILPPKRHENTFSDYEYQPKPVRAGDIEGKPYLQKPLDRPPMYTLEGVLPEPPESRRGRGTDPQNVMADQHRSMQSVDEGVGDIVAALEKAGQLENTVIFYVSDNGMLMGEHGEFNKKRWAYDPVIRIPMLVRYPKLATAGSVIKEMVLNIDVAPTILELAQVDPIEPMHGKSMVSLLENEREEWRSAFVTEYFYEKVVSHVRPWKSIRTEDWKFIDYVEPGYQDELYHLLSDPGEENNLIHGADAQPQLNVLKAKMTTMFQELDTRP